MDVKEAIETRRAYRALEPVEIDDYIIHELATAAQLTASCYNNQPWRFVFARSMEALARMQGCMNKGNEWTSRASLIIAAMARKDDDCLIREREYYLFDLGQAVSAMILRATELGLVAHPIAGFSPEKVRQAFNIPDNFMVITLINVGKKSDDTALLSEWQQNTEPRRPHRLPLANIYSVDSFDEKLNVKAER